MRYVTVLGTKTVASPREQVRVVAWQRVNNLLCTQVDWKLEWLEFAALTVKVAALTSSSQL